jgi:hypothetical protein
MAILAAHQSRYDNAAAILAEHRQPLDRNWRAFLWIATARPALWERIAPWVNLQRASVDWPGMMGGYWSAGEALTLRVAQSLYGDEGDVPLWDLAWLDDDLWDSILQAVRLHRGDRR